MEITENLTAAIHAAMDQTGGKGSEAARLLGLEPETLFNFIHNNKDLKTRWATSRTAVKPPIEAETISRAVIKVDGNRTMAEAMDQEDRMVRAGFESMGLKPGVVNLAMSLQAFQKKHFTRAIEVIGGGITKCFLDLMAEVEKINKELENPDLKPWREQMLRTDRAALLENMGRTYDRAQKAAMTQAIIKHKLEGDQGGTEKPRKPAFGPLIKGNNVQVNLHAEPK